jgi:four helix bundle protein
MHNFKELKIWQKSRILVKEIYSITGKLPAKEQYGIISQIQRASISIPSNIAEVSGRSGIKDFIRFLEIALGSSFELETLIIISNDLEYIKDENAKKIIDQIKEVQKMIFSFKNTLIKQ